MYDFVYTSFSFFSLMETIDLSEIISPGNVRVLCSSGKGWKDLTPEEHRERCKAISRGVRNYWDNISDRNYQDRCKVNNDRWTPEEKLRAAERSRKQWTGYSKERKKEILGKVFLNEAYRKAFADKRQAMTPEEKEEWTSRSFNNPEARKRAVKNMRIGLKKWWASLSKEEKEKQIEIRVSASRKTNAFGSSRDEIYLDRFLQKTYPGEWAYNGNLEQGVLIGNKIPDFININGKKEVIELFGCYWHSEDEVEKKIEHYKKYGFDCKIIWDYECNPVDIEKFLRR